MNYAPTERLDSVRSELRSAGYEVLDLNGAGVVNAPTFFAAASRQLFNGEPISNWDSFGDVLANSRTIVLSDRAALVWSHAHEMLTSGLRDLITATDVLTGISRLVYADDSRRFITFLIGDGPNFA